MRNTEITARLSGLGGAKWEVNLKAKDLIAQGRDVIDVTIGEPDVPTPTPLIDAAETAMRAGRTTYSNGRGEAGLRAALADRYSQRSGRTISADQVMCFPGTQTSLFAVLMGVAEAGCEVLVGDPMYATYEGVIRASGADMVPVPLRPENGFRIGADDIAARITPKTTALLLTTPHNPTGSILTEADIDAIGALAVKHDLWIISDEVYEELIFDGSRFVSPLSRPELADRVIVVSSISKSHAAPGFRSGWCVGPAAFTEALLPLSETMLFGNQPFIADMTEKAIRDGSEVAPGMRKRYAARAETLASRLAEHSSLKVHQPNAGMFAMIDVSSTGLSGNTYALHLLEHGNVAVMPGSSFGTTLDGWVRIALTVDDEIFDSACDRIIQHAAQLQLETA
ncbi:pyridoxal phosphate-dependent aminotransferase [Aliiroseovarius lamellibrachiae]|uniref:pyridoxal phosphate-dependent aminotransferase n=1 Tax=Aliiroseovarius lamellibrachiae TaxID=1924933 RepID=UPI001BE05496|nr:pyridoxal phosphate-dependent aminotransferase [Aliiroseovarius lamellibrachiae]MBT2130508.1 pyridoxal phosphate-dependent aminotransferase [Aliiroseovarius lamellibrachiae]